MRKLTSKLLFSLITIVFISGNSYSKALNYSEKVTSIKVINSGIGGNNTNDLLTRIEKDCYAHQPSLTILMVGTNDMNSRKHIPLEQYKQNLSSMVKEIKKRGSKVLLMTILPTYNNYLLTRHPKEFYEPEGPDGRRKQVNEVIKAIGKSFNVPVLDMEHRFSKIGKIGLDKESLIKNKDNSNKEDGIHPTSNGYRFIALSVFEFIKWNNLPTDKIVCFGDSITYGNGNQDSYPFYLQKLLEN